jgi:adenylate cyclase class 2
MYEVELKVEAAHGRVRDALRATDAEQLGTVRQEDTYYDAPHRDFAETDEALRVRVERTDDATETTLTYKGPLVEAASKTREEREVAVGDADAADAVLAGVGFEAAARVVKDRERFALRGYTVSLDAVEGLGEFVEVETRAEAVAEAREGARTLLADLGLDPEDHVRTSYLGLLIDNSQE